MNDAMVDHHPLGVMASRGSRGDEMIADAEHADDGVEEAPPLRIVAGMKIKDDGDMVADVDGLEDRRREGAERLEEGVLEEASGCAIAVVGGGGRGDGVAVHGSGRGREVRSEGVGFLSI